MSGGQPLASVRVPATTANLGPGFDAFGMALGLHATFTAVQRQGDGPTVRTAGADELPTGPDNLVWSSLVAACDHFGWDTPEVDVEVVTSIPTARGLGSSSSAIVGGLALARVLAGADASLGAGDGAVGDRDLVRLAAELEGHPDNVAPAVHGGLVACVTTDDGDVVTRLHLPPADTRPLLLVPPEASLTAEARGVVPQQLDRDDVVAQAARAGHVLAGLTGAWPVDPGAAGDRLHEPPRTAALGAGADLLPALRAAGLHAWLSGAGPSLAVLVPTRDTAATEQVHDLAEQAGHHLLDLTWDRQGIRSCVPDGCGVAGSPGCADCPLPSVG